MRLPTPPEITEAPELAMLASAEALLELMERALVAANPELVEQDAPGPESAPPILLVAQALILRAADLRDLLDRYGEELRRLQRTERPDDSPSF